MAQNKQHKDPDPATTDSKPKSKIGHWIRVVVSILSFGFIFPHAFTEYDDDIANHSTDKEAKDSPPPKSG
jgi:hypothetical protein